VKVFGRDKAFLPMTISGAMRDDFEALATGFIQIIGTDAHGRAILYHEKKRTDPQLHHRSSLWKSVFYILHVASSNSEIQKKGAVFIINFGRSRLKYFDRLYTKVATLQQVTGPVKVKAIHVQVGNWMLPPSFVMPVMLFAVPTSHRVRIKWYSSIEEIEKYGIFLSETLSSNSEILDDEVLERWLDAQAERERDT